MPRLLDLFCCAGGASVGYSRAGFEVHGCDQDKQKHYPFFMYRMDWQECLETYGHLYDAFAASPPCQGYSVLKHMTTKEHAKLLEPVRVALKATGKPYVIENVAGAAKHMIEPLMLCGSMFGLQTPCGAQLRRHRLFESNVFLMSPGECRHGDVTIAVQGHEATNERERMIARGCISVHGGEARDRRRTIEVAGDHARDPQMEREKYRPRTISMTGNHADGSPTVHDSGSAHRRDTLRETFTVAEARIAMGIDWMPMRNLSQAIPPAYTEWIGRQLIEELK